jgi:hypothetical protein
MEIRERDVEKEERAERKRWPKPRGGRVERAKK